MKLRAGLLVTLAAACGSGSDPQSPDELGVLLGQDPAPTVLQTYFSGLTEPASRLINSADEWARVWNAIHANIDPQPTRPTIDFSRDALVLVALGNSTAADLEITGVRRFERGVVAEVLLETYSERCLVLQAIGQPVHVVRIARPAGRALLVERTHRVRECT